MLSIWKRKGKAESQFDVPWPPVPIIADAAIATDIVGDGRFIPLVIMDTTKRPDIADMIVLQDHVPPGDVISAWVSLLDFKGHLALGLQFQRPVQLGVLLNFDLSSQGSVIDLAMRARAIYLQGGKPGDRFITTVEAPRMIAELGAEYPAQKWTETWAKAVEQKLRTGGYRKWEARKIAGTHIKQMRENLMDHRSLKSGIYVDLGGPMADDLSYLKKTP